MDPALKKEIMNLLSKQQFTYNQFYSTLKEINGNVEDEGRKASTGFNMNRRSRLGPAHMSLPPLGKAPANLPPKRMPNSMKTEMVSYLSQDQVAEPLQGPINLIPEATLLDRNRQLEKRIAYDIQKSKEKYDNSPLAPPPEILQYRKPHTSVYSFQKQYSPLVQSYEIKDSMRMSRYWKGTDNDFIFDRTKRDQQKFIVSTSHQDLRISKNKHHRYPKKMLDAHRVKFSPQTDKTGYL